MTDSLEACILEVLTEIDPEGLIEGVATDQYAPEARMLATALTKPNASKDVERIVLSIFDDRFDTFHGLWQDGGEEPIEYAGAIAPCKETFLKRMEAAARIAQVLLSES